MSSIGLISFICLLPFGKIKHYHGRLGIIIGDNWGGLSLGCFFFVCNTCKDNDYILSHECGHGIQNIILGPLFPFLVGIPSAIRYWYQTIRENKGLSNKPYDSIWFERWATNWGKKYIQTDIL